MAGLPDLPGGFPSGGNGGIGGGGGGNGSNGPLVRLIGIGLLSSVLIFRECNCLHSKETLVSNEEMENEEVAEIIKEGSQEVIKEGYDKLTQPKDTGDIVEYPIARYPGISYGPDNQGPRKEGEINSNSESCAFLNGSWKAIIKMDGVDISTERWLFHCYEDSKIEVQFDSGSMLFCGNSCFVEGNIYITDIYFRYYDTRGYNYNIKLTIKGGKFSGIASRTWNYDNKTYEYTIELKK